MMHRTKKVIVHKRKRMYKPIAIAPIHLVFVMVFGALVGGFITAGLYADIAIAKAKQACYNEPESPTLGVGRAGTEKAVREPYNRK